MTARTVHPVVVLVAALAAGGGSCPVAGLPTPCETPEIAIRTDLTFMMGGDPACLENGIPICANSVGDVGDRTIPEHMVTLSAYAMDQTEVSNIQYRACVDQGVCHRPLDCVPGAPFVGLSSRFATAGPCRYEVREYDDLPVVAVSWADADAYCRWKGKALPTEAQWERAAVGPRPEGAVARRFAWGDDDETTTRGMVVPENRCDGALRDRPRSVRTDDRRSGQSAEGIYDLTGSVREWTQDDDNPSFYCEGPGSGETRSSRLNDCGGPSVPECRRGPGAPPSPAVVRDPVSAGGTVNKKVVRGGAFCSTNASQVQHACDLHTRSRTGLHPEFLTPDIPSVPGAGALAGFLNDAQLTGFRCVRNGAPAATDPDRTCPLLPVDGAPYVPGASASSGGASSGTGSSAGSSSGSSSAGLSTSAASASAGASSG